MRLVVIESPLKGDVPLWARRIAFLARYFERRNRERNRRYARACMRDSVLRGEAPFASHLLYDQPGLLDDTFESEREKGILAGLAWGDKAHVTAVYGDLGFSAGMKRGIERAEQAGRFVEYRYLHERGAKGVWG